MTWTKEYNKEYMKEYYKNNKNKFKNYYKKNRIKIIKRNKEYRKTIDYKIRHKKYMKNWHINNKEKEKDYCFKKSEKILEKRKIWKKNNKIKVNNYQNKYRINNPKKNNAHNISNNYNLKESYCKICKTTKNLEGHHPDYNKPFKIITLCNKCHNKLHHNKLCLLNIR